jgi:hypothetical protein
MWLRRRPRIIVVRCRRCRRSMRVVKGSAIALGRVCNFCVYAEVNGGEETLVDLGTGR